MSEIRIRRGPASQLPVDAALGEPLYTTDEGSENLYIGNGPGVMPSKMSGVNGEVQAALEMKVNAVDVGTAAAKDVPATGNASSGQVVLGNDTRLSNSRTPTAHKASHAEGGSDPLIPADIGLGNVDNTADADKPVSTAVQAELDLKANKSELDDRDYETLSDADAAAVADGKLLVISTQWDTVPSTLNAIIKIIPGGKLNNSGALTMRVPIAGKYQIFVGAGSVAFTDDFTLATPHPEWFGVTGKGLVDDTLALRRFLNCGVRALYLGDQSNTYLIAPTVVGEVILPLTAPRTVWGHHAKLKIKDSSGRFYAFLGSDSTAVDLSGTVVTGITFDHNKGGNTYTATANVLDSPHFTFAAGNGSDIDFSGNVVLDPVCTNCVYMNDAGLHLVVRPRINNNIFLRVGGSAIAHDHSTVYVSGDEIECRNNYGKAAALGGTGAACFIETHSTLQTVTGNKGYDYDTLMNISGIYRGGDTELSLIALNQGRTLKDGIILYSMSIGAHTGGYGINGMDVTDNQIRIKQSSIVSGASVTCLGVAVQSGSTLPVRNLRIKRNTVEYDLETVANTHLAAFNAVGVAETQNNTVFEGVEVGDNTVINAPGPAVGLGRGNGIFKNCIIGMNTLANPAQGLHTSFDSYRAAVWLGGRQYTDSLGVAWQTVVDTHAVTRLNYGVMIVPTLDSTSCNVSVGIDITMTGDKTAFNRPVRNISSFTTPLITAKANKLPVFSAETFKAGSLIEDTLNGISYRMFADGQLWPSHGYATSAPASGTHQVGSTRIFTAPAAGGSIGTVCVTAGTPGTWKSYGAIAA